MSVAEEPRRRGCGLRNIAIRDKTNQVDRNGILGRPSNHITLGITFETCSTS